MKSDTEQPKIPESKSKTPKSYVDAKDELKTLPIAELKKKLGFAHEDLTQAEAH